MIIVNWLPACLLRIGWHVSLLNESICRVGQKSKSAEKNHLRVKRRRSHESFEEEEHQEEEKARGENWSISLEAKGEF